MTQWLDSQPIGSIITIRLPFGRFTYQGNGNVRIANFGYDMNNSAINQRPSRKWTICIWWLAEPE
jgi:hypothetical protein